MGSHAAQPCAACHSSGVYAGLPSECVDCHRADYDQTGDPAHAAAGFPTTCELCHQPTRWEDATFAHTTYPLVGVHAAQPCEACHSGGVYAGLPSDCVDCHRADYDQTREPDHQAAGFPTTCDTCHQPSDPDWYQADFAHTAWPLVGSHAAQPCAACHSSGVYAGLPSECVDCHRADYDQTSDPAHAAAGFPTTCELCHQPTRWEDTDFAHTTYPLLGVHATLPCAACHSSGVYAGLPSDCVDCHLDDYNTTTDPNHVVAGFPTDCALCHRASDTSWDQARFDHTYFPITSGHHAGLECRTCHVDPTSFAVFSCLDGGCHPQSETTPHHAGLGGAYQYDSVFCYSCHPDGQAPEKVLGVRGRVR